MTVDGSAESPAPDRASFAAWLTERRIPYSAESIEFQWALYLHLTDQRAPVIAPTAQPKSPIRTMVEQFMSMTATRRIAIVNDLLGEGTVSWEDDNPTRWPDLLAQVRERGLIDQLCERVANDGK